MNMPPYGWGYPPPMYPPMQGWNGPPPEDPIKLMKRWRKFMAAEEAEAKKKSSTEKKKRVFNFLELAGIILPSMAVLGLLEFILIKSFLLR